MIEPDFQQTLASLGLEQYYEQFVAEAFDSWPVLAQITESDLDALNVKRGHRRTLQVAITEYQQTRAGRATSEQSAESSSTATPREEVPRAKRKYIRHPRPDACAPEKPLTGYVLFANYTRDQLKDQKLTFPQIAKIVGSRWRDLPKSEKEVFLNRATELKDIATHKLEEYKRTSEYREYQRYLVDFKATQMGMAPSKRSYPDDDDQQQQQQQQQQSRTRRSLSLDQQSTDSALSAARPGYFAPVQSPTLLEPMLNMGPSAYGSSRYAPTSPDSVAPYRQQPVPFHSSLDARRLPPLMQVPSWRS